MRHRDFIACDVPHKAHLYRLPNFRSNEIPPRIESPSKQGIVIIPLFGGITNTTAGTERGPLMAALWARRSWLLNSDAMDYGIEIKLYLENHFRENEDIISILDENGVRDDDIIWFDGSPVEGAVRVHDKSQPGREVYFSQTAKKCTIYTHRELEKYEWVFDADSDLFVIKNGETRLPFFSDFFKDGRPYNLMSFYVNDKPPSPPHKTAESLRRVQFSSFDEWKLDFEDLFGPDMVDKYANPERWFLTAHKSLGAFPAKHFMANRWDDCELLIKIARMMLSDEDTLSVWHSVGNEIGDLSKTLDNCPMHLVVQPNVGYTVDEIHRLSDAGIPYIIHFGALTLELIWREGIGAL